MWISRRCLMACLALSLAFVGPLTAQEASPPKPGPKIQLAILLDTSNSMDGLINQARAQLWKIVNDLALAKHEGKRPDLEVALYEYGNDSLAPDTHWVRMVVPLTNDLDKVSEALFSLKTNGGSEYCGAVIGTATRELAWSDHKHALKMIFIAGNEPFNQGSIPYAESCKAAVGRGITVSTIFCGQLSEGVSTHWQHGAQLADGSFMAIDQNKVIAAVAAPQDKEIAELSGKLNGTYCVYGNGPKQQEFAARQEAQDKNAVAAAPGAASSRAQFKASAQYRNADWDLVDALKENKVKLEDLKPEQLPENLRKLTKDELAKHIAEKAAERKSLQEKIQKLSKARDAYLAEANKKTAEGDTGLDKVIIDATRKQAEKKSFKFE